MPEQPLIDVSPENWRIVHDILQRHVPDREVWAFGSRAKWTAKEYSDLDLAVIGEQPLGLSIIAELKDSFQESELPFKVDVVDWATIKPPLRNAIASSKVVVERKSGNAAMADDPAAGPGTGSWLYQPEFRADWARSMLFSLATWLNGMAFRDINFSLTGRPVIKIAEIKNGLSGQTKYTDGEYDPALLVKSGDMLFSWSGQPETSIDAFWWRGRDGWLNQHIFKVLPDASRCTAEFFFYLLKYLRTSFVGIARNKQTTGLGHVTRKDLEAITVGLPPLPEQHAIAAILGALDDKIELNRKMSATLEAMARALFKSWFVDFDPVRAKAEGRDPGLPPEIAALFPDSFEASELGQIPTGWHAGSVDDICTSIESGGTPARMTPEYWEHGTIPWFKTGELNDGPLLDSSERITDVALRNSSAKLWPAGTVLFALYASPTVGRMGLLTIPGTSNQAAAGLAADARYGTAFLFHTLLRARQELQHIAVGAAQQNINLGILKSHKIVVPAAVLAQCFSTISQPFVDRQVAIVHESRTLAALRDALLPKLISGEIRVTDAQRVVEKSA
ncbi:MAG: restriction endonuclease subunit S [Vulcanimicrobiaceae bacterium]